MSVCPDIELQGNVVHGNHSLSLIKNSPLFFAGVPQMDSPAGSRVGHAKARQKGAYRKVIQEGGSGEKVGEFQHDTRANVILLASLSCPCTFTS